MLIINSDGVMYLAIGLVKINENHVNVCLWAFVLILVIKTYW